MRPQRQVARPAPLSSAQGVMRMPMCRGHRGPPPATRIRSHHVWGMPSTVEELLLEFEDDEDD